MPAETEDRMKPGRKRDCELWAWCERYGLDPRVSSTRRKMTSAMLNALSHCKSEEARRILLGISK